MKKQELCDSLEKIIPGIDFSKLNKIELMKMYEFFDHEENLLMIVINSLGVEEYIKTSQKLIKEKILESRPLKNLLKELLT